VESDVARATPGKKRRILRILLAVVLITPVLLGVFAVSCDAWVRHSAAGRVYGDVNSVPPKKVALVLGTSRRTREGATNTYFASRMTAATELFKAGKVKHIIASGANPTQWYDEPTEMKKALVAMGVPEEAITLDYAGFRTLDSIVRVNAIFSQDDIIVVSQRFHNERAIFLARYHGIEAIGYNAGDVALPYRFKMRVREYLARCKAVLDVYVLGTEPKFYGEKVDVPV
jgi:SanA protein